MLKDIDFTKSEQVGIGVVDEGTEGETSWTVYFINFGPDKVETVLVSSRGYGEIDGKKVETATLRWMLGDLEPETICKIEEMPEGVSRITNEFWVSYYIGNKIYDKKYVFVVDSLTVSYMTNIPVLNKKGILIK